MTRRDEASARAVVSAIVSPVTSSGPGARALCGRETPGVLMDASTTR